MKPAILLALVLAGCSGQEVQYRNANGGGQAEFDRDDYQCTRENTSKNFTMVGRIASTDDYTDDAMVRACLRARGWYPTTSQAISPPTAPPATSVQLATQAYRAGDYSTALRLYRQSAAEGNAISQKMFGVMYYKGEGITKDYAQAAAWTRKAADQGEAEAQKNLGTMYQLGHGVPQNFSQAMQWNTKAAAGGNSDGMLNIGNLYQYGLGVPKDTGQARYWYNLAAAKGNEGAAKRLSSLPAK